MCGILVKPVEPGQVQVVTIILLSWEANFSIVRMVWNEHCLKFLSIYLAPMLHHQQTILGEEMHLLITLWLALWLLIIL